MALITGAGGAGLLFNTASLREQEAGIRESLPITRPGEVISTSPDYAQLLGQLTTLELGRGYGLMSVLADLEAQLPKPVQIRRLQYNLADGTAHLDVEVLEERWLSETVIILEQRFGEVRILDRQAAGQAKSDGLRMRIQFREGSRP